MSSKEQSQQKITSEEEQQAKKKLEDRLNKEIERNSKPMWLTNMFVQYPCRVIGVNGLIFVICLILTFAFNTFEMIEPNNREYLIFGNDRVQVLDMWNQMQDDFLQGQSGAQVPERSQSEPLWTTNVMINCENCNDVLNKDGIKALYKIENKIRNHKDYEKFCLATTDSSDCGEQAYTSITMIAETLNLDVNNLSDDDVTAIKDYILEEQNFEQWKYLVGKDFNENNKKTTLIRTLFQFGVPLKLGKDLKKDKFDDIQDQRNAFSDFTEEILAIRDNNSKGDMPKGGELFVWSFRADMVEFQREIDSDFLWAFASICFVWFYISCHLGSIFLGSIGMFSILISFPITQVLFNLVFRISYFSSLHIMAIFIVLGIAADDIFVFIDAWDQTAFYHTIKHDYKKRMALTFRRASNAMLATSSTTSAAFLATGLSTLMPVSSFGFFAGILIPINFLLTVLFFPSIVIFYENSVKHRFNCIKNLCKKNQKQQQQQKNNQQQSNNNNNQDQEVQQQQPQNQEQKAQEEEEDEKEPWIEIFFATTFNNFVNKFKYPIFLVFAIWIGIAVWQTTQISPISEPEKFLPEDHPSEIGQQLVLEDFHSSSLSDTGIKVYQFWGVKDIDASETSKWDPEALGKIEWDNNFNLHDNLEEFYDYCEQLKSNSLVEEGEGAVLSFIFDFKAFVSDVWPTNKKDLIQKLEDFSKNDTMGKYFYNLNHIGLIKGELKYIQIKIAAKGASFRPYKEQNPLYLKWDRFLKSANKKFSKGLDNSKQTAGFQWTWMISERAFVTNAIQGMSIAIGFGFIVLILSTHNIIVALFSILSISGIVVSVVGIMNMVGWELGIAESITMVILIGLSVDYVVHLANHYVESVYTSRHQKIMISLKELGISIVSGALTTAGSGLFLIFGTVLIFNKFAILIICTIFFSLAFSLLFFSALMHAFGPEGNVGNLLVLCKKKNSDSQIYQSTSKDNIGENKQVNIVEEASRKDTGENNSDKQNQKNSDNAVKQDQDKINSDEIQDKQAHVLYTITQTEENLMN